MHARPRAGRLQLSSSAMNFLSWPPYPRCFPMQLAPSIGASCKRNMNVPPGVGWFQSAVIGGKYWGLRRDSVSLEPPPSCGAKCLNPCDNSLGRDGCNLMFFCLFPALFKLSCALPPALWAEDRTRLFYSVRSNANSSDKPRTSYQRR